MASVRKKALPRLLGPGRSKLKERLDHEGSRVSARLGSASLVSVVQSPNLKNGYDPAPLRLFNSSRLRRIFGQG
jgi:hypothetical protein